VLEKALAKLEHLKLNVTRDAAAISSARKNNAFHKY